MKTRTVVRATVATLISLAFFAAIGFGKPNWSYGSLSPPANAAEVESLMRSCSPRVAKETMYRLVLIESEWKPYTIHINEAGWKLPFQPRTKGEAVRTAESLIKQGFSIDMGYAQVNSGNLKLLGVSVQDLFDQCTNLSSGERVLVGCYNRAKRIYPNDQKALRAALSCYNTGDFTNGIKNGYVDKVFKAQPRRH